MATRTKGKSQPEMPTRTMIADAIRSIYKENAMDTDAAFSFAFMNQQSAITAAMNANAPTSTDKENAMTAIIDTTTATATAATENTKEIAMQNATATTTAATETAATETTAPSLGAMLAKRLGYTAKENEVDEPVSAPKTETNAETLFWNAVEKYHGMREDAPRSFAKAVADGEVPEDVLIELARRDAITAQNALFAYQDTETFFATVDAQEEAEKAEKIEPDAVADLDAAASNAENTLYELIKRTRTIAVENAKLMAQLEKLAAKNAALEAENAALKAQVAEQQESLESKDALIDELRGSINEQSEEIASKANLIALMQQQLEANSLALKQKSADEATAIEMARQAEDEAAMLKAAITQRDAEANALKAAVHTASNDAMAWAKAAHDAAAKAAVLQEKLQSIAKMLS